jgi:hypothetical protein
MTKSANKKMILDGTPKDGEDAANRTTPATLMGEIAPFEERCALNREELSPSDLCECNMSANVRNKILQVLCCI